MKKLVLSLVLIGSALAPFVIAACPSPNLPVCPANVPLMLTFTNDTWTCCDMTAACSTDGTKYPRFNRSQAIARYLGSDGHLHDCVVGGYSDSGEISCCD